MADIEVVIKIPEKVKQAFDRAESNDLKGGYYDHGGVIGTAIKNGIVLPEGHGRLIDADAFISKMEDVSKRHKYKELLINDLLTVDDVFKAVIESLQNEGLAEGDAPTIIEKSEVRMNGYDR